MEKALFDWPIVLQHDFKAMYQLISRKFSGIKIFSPERSPNQPKATHVCVRSISDCCFCFVGACLFQGQTKIALTGGSSPGVLYGLPKVHKAGSRPVPPHCLICEHLQLQPFFLPRSLTSTIFFYLLFLHTK